ncbi:MAG: hypothetical protein AAGD34_08750 [Pseudomonadota bacterium]
MTSLAVAALPVSAAILALSMVFSTPAAAQVDCEPGSLGEGGDFSVGEASEEGIQRVILTWQCGEILADGTFIPEGYRAEFFRGCTTDDCVLDMRMAERARREGTYTATIYDEDAQTRVNLRAGRRDGVVMVVRTSFEDGRDRVRTRHTLTAN